jgi:predicted aspartyl protease
LIVVPVEIGSQSNLKFILDTGTTRTVVDKRVARKLGIHGVPHTVIRMHDTLDVQTAIFPELQFGAIRITNIRLLIEDLSSITDFADGVDGILGLDVFWGSKISVDYDSKRVLIDSLAAGIDDSAQPKDHVCVTTMANVHGTPIRLLVDTGMPGILLYGDRVRERISTLPRSRWRVTRIGHAMFATHMAIDKINVGTQEMRNVDALVVKSAPPSFPRNVDGILGTESLKARRLIFDFSRKIMTWQH